MFDDAIVVMAMMITMMTLMMMKMMLVMMMITVPLTIMGMMIMMIQKMDVSITRWDNVLNPLITDSHKVYVCASLPACLIT